MTSLFLLGDYNNIVLSLPAEEYFLILLFFFSFFLPSCLKSWTFRAAEWKTFILKFHKIIFLVNKKQKHFKMNCTLSQALATWHSAYKWWNWLFYYTENTWKIVRPRNAHILNFTDTGDKQNINKKTRKILQRSFDWSIVRETEESNETSITHFYTNYSLRLFCFWFVYFFYFLFSFFSFQVSIFYSHKKWLIRQTGSFARQNCRMRQTVFLLFKYMNQN